MKKTSSFFNNDSSCHCSNCSFKSYLKKWIQIFQESEINECLGYLINDIPKNTIRNSRDFLIIL